MADNDFDKTVNIPASGSDTSPSEKTIPPASPAAPQAPNPDQTMKLSSPPPAADQTMKLTPQTPAADQTMRLTPSSDRTMPPPPPPPSFVPPPPPPSASAERSGFGLGAALLVVLLILGLGAAWYIMPGVLAGKAQQASSAGDHAKAAKTLRMALKLKPLDAAPLWIFLGRELRLSKDLTGAQKSLEQALDLKPGNPETLKELGQTYADLGQKQKALDAFQEFLQAEPEDAETQNWAAQLAYDLQEYPLAASLYERIVKERPASAQAWFNLGRSYFEMKKYQEAERALLSAAERDGKQAGLNIFLAKTYVLESRYVEAAKFFRAEIALQPQDAVLKQTYVEVCERAAEDFINQKQPNEAASMLSNALSIPSGKEAGLNYKLAQVFAGMKRGNDVMKNLAAAVKLDSSLKKTAARDRAFIAYRKQPRFQKIIR